MAFTSDSRIAALPVSRYRLILVDTATGRELATLEHPHREPITWACFSPDATHLVSACSTGAIRIWNLRLIRQRLSQMGLDWHLAGRAG